MEGLVVENVYVEERAGGVLVVGWAGETVLDASNADGLREEITGRTGEYSPWLVFDMTPIRFIDSSAIGALVGLMREARAAGGDLKLVGLNPDLRTIFELMRLDGVFGLHPSVDEAVRDFDGPG